MGNAKYIGRVGGLAVALGIGAAVASWPGAAIAESPAADSATSAETSSDSSSATADSDSTGDAESDPTPDTADTSAAADAEDVDPRSGVVTATGGAETGASADRQNQEAAGEDPDLVEPDDDELGGDKLSQVADDPPSDDTVASSSPAPAQANDTRRVVVATTNLPPSLSRNPIDPVGASAAASWSTAQEYGVSNVHFPTAPTAPIEQAQVTRTMSIAAGTPSAPTGVVTNLVAGLLGLIGMGPAASSSPLAPVEPPFVSAVLAWVRRQVQRTFFNQTPTVRPQQTEQLTSGVVTGQINGFDADGDPVVYTVTRAPTNGTVTVDADGSYTYTPTAGALADDSFEVKVSDVGLHLHLGNLFAPDFGRSRVVTVPVDVAEAVVGATIPVGDNPIGIGVSRNGSRVYVANVNGDSVSVIDTATNTVSATLPMPNGPVTVSTSGSGAYLAVPGTGVVVVDTATDTVTTTVLNANLPQNVTVAPSGNFAYVIESGNRITVLNTTSNTFTGTVIPVGDTPQQIAFNPLGSRAYVTNVNGGTVSVIDVLTNSVIATIPVGNGPSSAEGPAGVAVSPDGTRLYVTGLRLNGPSPVYVIDTATNTVIGSVDAGVYAGAVTVSPDGTAVFVSNFGSDTVTVIDAGTMTVIDTVPVGDGPAVIAFSPDGQRLYVANANDDTVSVITFD